MLSVLFPTYETIFKEPIFNDDQVDDTADSAHTSIQKDCVHDKTRVQILEVEVYGLVQRNIYLQYHSLDFTLATIFIAAVAMFCCSMLLQQW
jgi:hypothetical protein